MTVHIQSDRPARGPHDIVWDAPGAVAAVEDHTIARQILRQPGFSEVDPTAHGRHEAPEAPTTEPTTEPTTGPADEDGEGEGEAKKTRARRTAVTE